MSLLADARDNVAVFAVGGGLGLVLGLTLGWKLYRPGPPVVEAAASAVRQKDGSLELARAATTSAPGPAAHALPAGATEERRIRVTVQPRWSDARVGESPAGSRIPGALPPAPTCPAVSVDMTLARMPDGTRRVVASSPDGSVVGGIDVPIGPMRPEPRPTRWAAGGSYNPVQRDAGAWVERDLGPFRLGVEAVRFAPRPGQPADFGTFVRVGVRW